MSNPDAEDAEEDANRGGEFECDIPHTECEIPHTDVNMSHMPANENII